MQTVVAQVQIGFTNLDKADKEVGMHDKMVCQCETHEKQTTKAITDAHANVAVLVVEYGD